jgi:hypothetical protein
MTRQRLIVLTALVFALAVGWAGWRCYRLKLVITFERMSDIQQGMTLAEVTAIIGGPPGDYTGGDAITYMRGSVGEDSSVFYEGTNWWGREGMIQVQFDQYGRVESAGYYSARSIHRADMWSRLRTMLPFGGQRNRHEWLPGNW